MNQAAPHLANRKEAHVAVKGKTSIGRRRQDKEVILAKSGLSRPGLLPQGEGRGLASRLPHVVDQDSRA